MAAGSICEPYTFASKLKKIAGRLLDPPPHERLVERLRQGRRPAGCLVGDVPGPARGVVPRRG
ncbi:hypothetical protein Misp01_67860 [Microtetraspora sp. NBRC 13810]|uniref:hypothetical protein n=1 Tax=Microtetraspora sp. NBRC 13810 TaxID=3030990 RepID=UPI0024A40158|nr:hypothetical protein [Microtetraspora sp. NBRC 13810]GLW11658.1 hypothetical protein Misp01_67860 [Microtetraspora sp. NBRC 13810]